MKILFVSYSRGWGFLEDTYNYVFKPLGSKHFRIRGYKSYASLLASISLRKYDVIWCEESGFIPTMWRYFLRKNRLTNNLYRNRETKILTRFHFHNCAEYLSVRTWKAVENIAESDMVLSVSNYWKNTIKRNLPFMDLDVHVVHNGVDTSRFVPDPALKQEKTIFYLASTYHRKRLHLLIKAMNHLPDFRLIIGGTCKPFNVQVEQRIMDEDVPEECYDSANYWNWCHKLAKPNEERIVWKGFVSEETKLQCYQKASIFVLPSTIESWGVVLMEAMSCKLPILGTNNGGTPEFVPKNQLLPLDLPPEHLAARIRQLDGDTQIGAHNRKIVAKYDWPEIRSEVDSCLASIK